MEVLIEIEGKVFNIKHFASAEPGILDVKSIVHLLIGNREDVFKLYNTTPNQLRYLMHSEQIKVAELAARISGSTR